VIVDLAAEQGGNCELTVAGEEVVQHGVTIIGYTDLASRMAHVASDLYGNNVAHLLDELGGPDGFTLDTDNDIVRGALVVHRGELRWPPPPPRRVEPEVKASREGSLPTPAAPAVVPAAVPAAVAPAAPAPRTGGATLATVLGIAVAAGALGLRFGAPDAPVDAEVPELLQHLTVFVLSVFVGWQVVWNVTPALHTPLMSVTNAISGIIVVGGLLAATSGSVDVASGLGLAAVFFATLNIAGGFLVTRRMLAMFRR
jgi:NAD(P) transhydrogenase subunit alpha